MVDDQTFKPRLRVTGGSGSFENARGTFEVVALPNGSQGQAYHHLIPTGSAACD
jgi:hypothetical protein